jgi:hypothetical protein
MEKKLTRDWRGNVSRSPEAQLVRASWLEVKWVPFRSEDWDRGVTIMDAHTVRGLRNPQARWAQQPTRSSRCSGSPGPSRSPRTSRLRGQRPAATHPTSRARPSSSASTCATAARRAAPRRSSPPARSRAARRPLQRLDRRHPGACLPSLRHRIILNFEGEAEGITTEAVVRAILDRGRRPAVE